jgi:hypothetical protein
MKITGRLISYITVSATSREVLSFPYLIFPTFIHEARQKAFREAFDANKIRPQLRSDIRVIAVHHDPSVGNVLP